MNSQCRAKEITAIMGPSGAGKTSLLNILAGRASTGGRIKIDADVRLNNFEVDPTKLEVRKQIAFVAQDDSLQVTSTPREAIRFSAKLRLPRSVTDEEIELLTNRMIEELGLTDCADTIVGGALIKGISGGQRKRTSVGVELVTKPALVFLDEPTSGLDSFSAVQLCQVLKKVANGTTKLLRCSTKGNTVCLVFSQIESHHCFLVLFSRFKRPVHHPSTLQRNFQQVCTSRCRHDCPIVHEVSIHIKQHLIYPFRLLSTLILSSFDHLILMNKGRVMYQGAVANVPRFFDDRNQTVPHNYNPADWIMNVAQSVDIKTLESSGFFPEDDRPIEDAFGADDSMGRDVLGITKRSAGENFDARSVGMLTEIRLLFVREVVNFRRDTAALATKFGLTMFLGLLIGTIFFDVGATSNTSQSVSAHHRRLTLDQYKRGIYFSHQFDCTTSECSKQIRGFDHLYDDGHVWNSARCSAPISSRETRLSQGIQYEPLQCLLLLPLSLHHGSLCGFGPNPCA